MLRNERLKVFIIGEDGEEQISSSVVKLNEFPNLLWGKKIKIIGENMVMSPISLQITVAALDDDILKLQGQEMDSHGQPISAPRTMKIRILVAQAHFYRDLN